MFRVYDKVTSSWAEDNIYLALNGDLFELTGNIFKKKLKPAAIERYVYHKDIGLYDKNNVLIYEGDVVEAKVSDDKIVVGTVAYANELASYVILCHDCDEYYILSQSVCEFVEIVGNVFDYKKDK